MTKKENIERFQAFIKATQVEDRSAYNHTKIQGANDGRDGLSAEAIFKLKIGNIRGACVSPGGRIDTKKASFTIEVKTGYGNVGVTKRKDEKSHEAGDWIIPKRDLIVWTKNSHTMEAEEGFVILAEDFWKADLFRTCVGTTYYCQASTLEEAQAIMDINTIHWSDKDQVYKGKKPNWYKNQVNFKGGNASGKSSQESKLEDIAWMTLADFFEMLRN